MNQVRFDSKTAMAKALMEGRRFRHRNNLGTAFYDTEQAGYGSPFLISNPEGEIEPMLGWWNSYNQLWYEEPNWINSIAGSPGILCRVWNKDKTKATYDKIVAYKRNSQTTNPFHGSTNWKHAEPLTIDEVKNLIAGKPDPNGLSVSTIQISSKAELAQKLIDGAYLRRPESKAVIYFDSNSVSPFRYRTPSNSDQPMHEIWGSYEGDWEVLDWRGNIGGGVLCWVYDHFGEKYLRVVVKYDARDTSGYYYKVHQGGDWNCADPVTFEDVKQYIYQEK